MNDQTHPEKSKCKDVDDQQVVSVTQRPNITQQDVMCHRVFDLQVGGFYSFRIRQCGDAGVYRICFAIWDPGNGNWRRLRSWSNVTRCQNDDGGGNCVFQFMHEMASVGAPFFDLNGGPDGLKMRDIRVRTAPFTWPLMGNTEGNHWWTEPNAPYTTCADANYYRFRTFHGPANC